MMKITTVYKYLDFFLFWDIQILTLNSLKRKNPARRVMRAQDDFMFI